MRRRLAPHPRLFQRAYKRIVVSSTANTTLDGNVTGCANNGIVVGADNITLNLAGFTVSGMGAPGDGAGILITNRTGVTVLNGTVTLLQANQAIGNGQDGFVLGRLSNDNRLIGNSALGNGFDGPESARGSGVKLLGSVFRTYVYGNTASRNALHGIAIAPTLDQVPVPSLQNQIIRNTSINNEQFSPLLIGYDLLDGNPFCDSNTWQQNNHFTENFPGSDCLS